MVRVLATGGTIASLPDPETGAVRPALAAAELVRDLDGVVAEDVAHVSGWNVTPATMLDVAGRAAAAGEPVVVTHGTDTVEETAFFCDVTVAGEAPVVFAAAMRSGAEPGADGPRNLRAAIAVAGDPAARGLGALVVLGDEIHAARRVRKLDSFRTSAFASPGHGPVGTVRPGAVAVPAGPPRHRVTVPLPAALDAPVPIVQAHTGMDPGLIEAVLAATGAAGLVVEGTGLGNVPGSAEPGMRAALAAGLPVVVATRVPAGGTGAVYGGPGGGATLRDAGVLAAGELSAAKARLLLMLLLAGGEGDVQGRFVAAVEALATW